MSIFQVHPFPKSKYHKVEASSTKKATEKHYGAERSEIGNHQPHVLVHYKCVATNSNSRSHSVL